MSDARVDAIRSKAVELGFDVVAFAPARLDHEAGASLAEYLSRHYHGDMTWLADTAARRSDPRILWPEARTAIMLGMSYAPGADALELISRPDRANVSVYARGQDYHDVVKKRLKALARWLVERHACDVKVFVDTAPVMEKPLAQSAGIGWQGKHTNLVSRRHGSWLFLGSVLTTLELAADRPEKDHCGRCRRCLDVCPTDAFPAPHRLDARRCISYLTIEHKGHIPHEFRVPIGNRIYGCDDCLAVCPWNKFATRARELAFSPRPSLAAPRLTDLVHLDDAGFRRIFAGSAIKRIGRDRFVRNVLIAIGNGGDDTLVPAVERLIADPSPLVRAMAIWALCRLAQPRRFAELRATHEVGETDPEVAAEWRRMPAQNAAE